MWLCPNCEASRSNCKICDGTGFLSDAEFGALETRKKKSSKIQTLLTLDLSEFESENNKS